MNFKLGWIGRLLIFVLFCGCALVVNCRPEKEDTVLEEPQWTYFHDFEIEINTRKLEEGR